MSYVSALVSSSTTNVSRPLVKALFVSSCLLSIVSWYTTQQGMALYLAPWFALLASLGVQSALLLVAWLIGFTKEKRALLIAVYAITGVVSIAFSYVSLYTWFSARDRPAAVQRKLYDRLNEVTSQAQGLLAAAVSEGQNHVLALEEMTGAEKSHGYISRAQDVDPYLARIREAVAREAQTYNPAYREGSGEGLRYTAFDRYAKLARQTVIRLQEAQRSLVEFRVRLKPLEPTENQLLAFRQAYDPIPWSEVEQSLHAKRFELPALPVYADFVDHSITGQEDLLLGFQELFTKPGGRHIFAFALAAFIDIVVFLLAYSSGPYFFGSSEQRWITAAAALDARDEQLFVRDFLRKLSPGPQRLNRVEASALTIGEQQLCMLLAARGQAATVEEDGKKFYLLDRAIHEQMVDYLASQSLPMRAAAQRVTMEA